MEFSAVADRGAGTVPVRQFSGIPAADGTEAEKRRSVGGRSREPVEDRVTLSAQQPGQALETGQREPKPGERTTADGRSVEDPQVKQTVERLKRTEEKVKAHEAAHKAAGGNLAGSASYSYTQGPDGRSYITGGEVQIDVSGGRTPEETIARMQQVIRAALAPADPSGQDRAVAAQAANQMAQAQQEKRQPESLSGADAGSNATSTGSGEALRPTGDGRVQRAYGDPAVRGREWSQTTSFSAVSEVSAGRMKRGVSREGRPFSIIA
ncbi:putative metalloprotease CJM1_0395 family protein [Trichlorobacter ammonificans]|uniref:Catalase n=1 Tax=Trichlorobacter ammonificans TaxID=2916410 RepID=A0ABM9DCQ3_9BACT|nr:putative metalloprotease CJM1_0395 family protein [Trichlorobacter ammonificans]CAH2032517.1 conserved protein of unknown function [Trichlorobacter ammonificans]